MTLQPFHPGQPLTEAGLSLSDWADIANVVVAFMALGFSVYSFWIQRERDRKSKRETADSQNSAQIESERLRAQTIRLQWYKDLVITPNIEQLDKFYSALHGLSSKITTPNLDDIQKRELIEEVKEALQQVRKSLVDSILPINVDLHNKVLACLDQLVDGITNAIDDDTLKLSNPTVNEAKIGNPIRESKRNILTLIYGYRGE